MEGDLTFQEDERMRGWWGLVVEKGWKVVGGEECKNEEERGCLRQSERTCALPLRGRFRSLSRRSSRCLCF